MNTGVDIREGSPLLEEEKIFVAVGNVIEENSATLLWAMKKFWRKNICILHVHQPTKNFGVLGANFGGGIVDERLVTAHQEMERRKILGILKDYCDICAAASVSAEKIYIEMNNIEKGIVELILQHGITKLIMGAAADKRYSKNMAKIKSKKAKFVYQNAPNSCHIWFVCKRELVCQRQPIVTRGSLFHNGENSIIRATSFSSLSSSSSNWTASLQTPRSYSQRSDGSRHSIRSDEETGRLSLGDSSPANESWKAKEPKNFKSQLDQIKQKPPVVVDQKLKLESQIADFDRMVAELIEKKVLSATQQLVAIQKEIDQLQKLRTEREKEFASLQAPQQYFSVFSAIEIESATWSFDPSMKIGEGGFGNVYKGILRQTPVAVKRYHPHKLAGQSSSDIQVEVNILSRVRHQNLVTLIGVCHEASSLVLEYLPNGSLEDRLTYKDGTLPLPWKTRMRIAKEICSALIFLHRNEPQIVHGDLKPSNILLDCNFVSKLCDFGIANFITRDDEYSTYTTTLFCMTDPKGTIAYIDPEFFATGVLTTKADVYSFGVVLLQLLTGKPAIRLPMKVQIALDQGTLNDMLDSSAGDWPLDQAKKLAQMALRCCEVSRKNRPNLEFEVWRQLLLLDVDF
ncbi:hypothetical protein NE237_007998 [Protea cynaroides]|uniref:RING-type E3 ubiquitin transferase n=1 Tax=Protea cynaroides TaxID=273540 RepID=A0A9Q0KQK0_9MAGN|nr:hypothetical protein NE237_007998 [Protea cynaroides]